MSEGRGALGPEVLKELKSRGLDEGTVLGQIEMFERGLTFADLVRPCTDGDGVVSISDAAESYAALYDEASQGLTACKFVPASGAATRMFKELAGAMDKYPGLDARSLEEASGKGDSDAGAALRFVREIREFAFFEDLVSALSKDGLDAGKLIEEGRLGPLVEYTLGKGLDYSSLPKGIIKFHRYPERNRTAFEEHLVEALRYAADGAGTARAHFTLSPEHVETVSTYIAGVKDFYEGGNRTLDVTYSVQSPATDTIAVGMDNRPFLDADGKPVFRPGGHGALIRNLGALHADIAFIKNVDNVVPDRLKADTYLYKRAIGGYLVRLRHILFSLIRSIERNEGPAAVDRGLTALSDMGLRIPGAAVGASLLDYLRRPVRIAGVVRNTGEPGGGPFFVRGRDGVVTPQIVESAQVDMQSAAQRSIWESSAYFNPVDLVCGLTDENGMPYDLPRFVDPEAGFISQKSSGGRDLKALELPGLWNGGMAFWHTVFVEVPISTFNPVKTVFDLLRPEHLQS